MKTIENKINWKNFRDEFLFLKMYMYLEKIGFFIKLEKKE